MKYRQSSTPYLILLFTLVIGIPAMNYQVEQAQSIKIKIKASPLQSPQWPIASK
ncbi:MAG: hypothetical protein AAF960_27805 [Bacteroidota bacterium]